MASQLPITANVNDLGHLEVGGRDLVDLQREYGSPLYVFDEATLRENCRIWKRAFEDHVPRVQMFYAAKALAYSGILDVIRQEGWGVDVVSEGEIRAARHVGFSSKDVVFHGNNKTPDELRLALEFGTKVVVVDNEYELSVLSDLATQAGKTVPVMIRVNPDVDPHTHEHISTGQLDSKFGLPISTGLAEKVCRQASEAPGIKPVGIHFHLGSQIETVEPYLAAIDLAMKFGAEMTQKYDFRLDFFSPGGGFGVRQNGTEVPTPEYFASRISERFQESARQLGVALPTLLLELGRSVVAQAAVAVYMVGSLKHIDGVRSFAAVDGGMSDNIRPALYGAEYPIAVANRMDEPATQSYRIVGKYCESGDVLVNEAKLPTLEHGDLLVMPMVGAYAPAMASNYNMAYKPAVIMVSEGEVRMIRRRESFEDLIRLES